MGPALALLSATTFGVADFLGGMATSRSKVIAVTTVSNLSGAVVAVMLVVAVGGRWSTGVVVGGAVAGLLGMIGLVLLYQGLAIGPNRLVSPLAAVISAVVPVTVGLTLGDRPGSRGALGLLLAPVAVWMVAGGDVHLVGKDRRPLLYAIGAGLGFGWFFVALDQVPDDGGAIPLLAARVVSVLALVAISIGTKTPRPTAGALPIAVAAGGLDMIANGLYLWSTLHGELSIVAALVALFPATTVLLAVIFLGERLTTTQTIGLVFTVATAALLS